MGDNCCPKNIRCPTVKIRDSAKDREESKAYCCNGKRVDEDGRECGARDFCSSTDRAALDACCKRRGWRDLFKSPQPCTAPNLSCGSECKEPRCCTEAKTSCGSGSPRDGCDCQCRPACCCAQKCGVCCRARESCSCENPCPCRSPSPSKCCRPAPEAAGCEPQKPCCRPKCCDPCDRPKGSDICCPYPMSCAWLSGAICTITAIAAAVLIWKKFRDRS